MNEISVIIPVYNTASYLRRCVGSILAQSCKPTEIILIDDGSTDDSAAICDALAAEHPDCVHVIHQTNAGSGAARNRGIDIARGEILSFIDSDDYIDADMYERLLENMKKHDATMSTCEMVVEKPNGESWCRVKEDIELCWNTEEALVELNSYRYLHTSFCNALFDRQVIGELRFPEGTRCEDYLLLYKVAARCRRVAYTSLPMYHYLQRENSNSRSINISLAPIKASIEQVTFFNEHFPQIAYAAKTDCAFSHIGIYTAYVRNGMICPRELLRKLLSTTRKYLWSVLINPNIPQIKKLQALAFVFALPIYKLVIAKTEHR